MTKCLIIENMEKENLNTSFLAKWFEGSITDAVFKQYVSDEEFLHYQKLKRGVDAYVFFKKPVDTTFEVVREKIAKKKKHPQKLLYTRWAVSIAAGLVLLVGLYSILSSNLQVIKTAIGEQKNIVLVDGSRVTLNGDSQVSYNENTWDDKREITLQGEAFFTVKKGSKFIVNTKNGNVNVLGTSFDVNSSQDYFEVTCFTGKVSVTPNKKDTTIVLVPGTYFRKSAQQLVSGVNLSKRPSWIDGESSFNKVALKYVLSTFEKQYNVKFVLDNIDASVIFTGSFTHHDINIALESIFLTAGIRYKQVDEQTIVLDYSP